MSVHEAVTVICGKDKQAIRHIVYRGKNILLSNYLPGCSWVPFDRNHRPKSTHIKV